ncbi:uncharacterized protein ALTATR162_LOCUS12079 [Alternaria atra]|uniref:Zn(2)-C6 fungal-type domain-containing protein n=1 Tax=Alternaria atra TaxID=119953 RepID=A0A8J2N5Q9_9PLEO|nr:uncharacterized protein ALTATR162_LOCUS12079 [Alternaria atra]CAG5188986.1 unnamed protein product [Alternaria atra]
MKVSQMASHQHDVPRRLPMLLPAPAGTIKPPEQPRKRPRLSACDACRTRKTKCTNEQPQCSQCIKHQTACRYSETEARVVRKRYEDLKTRMTAHEELFELLRSMPEPEAKEVFQRARSGDKIEEILAHVKNGSLLMQLAVAPETNRRYEFPYRSEMPMHLLVPDNQYLGFYSVRLLVGSVPIGPYCILTPSRCVVCTVQIVQDPYLKPIHAAELDDPLLSQVSASKWTNVISNDVLFRRLLSNYFLYCHPLLYCFHMKYFLRDMVAGQTRFCSSLLVNAVLGAAYQTYGADPDRSKHWLPDNLDTTAIVIHLICDLIGVDHVGNAFTQQAIAMSQEINLFKSPTHIKSKRMRNARILSAWGLFDWCLFEAYHMFRMPLLKDPPEMPFPDPLTNPGFHDEMWLRYPLATSTVPAYYAHTITARRHLSQIKNDVVYKVRSWNGFEDPLLFSTILQIENRLKNWFQNLPPAMQARNIVFPPQLEVHLEYHSIIVELFRRGRTGADRSLSARRILESNIRMETILRIYYLRHSFDSFTNTMMVFMVYIGNFGSRRPKQQSAGQR